MNRRKPAEPPAPIHIGGMVAQTQHERRTETRGRLLAAAADLFAEHGIDAVSVDAIAEAADRTSGAVYAHFGSKQGLLLAVLDSWKQSVLTALFADVAVTDSPMGQLAAVWDNVGDRSDGGRWALLEHELWLRATRDTDVADVLRARDAESRRRSARELAKWATAVDARPAANADDLATLVKALLIGLDMQRRIDPGSVTRGLAVQGLAALLGLAPGALATEHDDNHGRDESLPSACHTTHDHRLNTTR